MADLYTDLCTYLVKAETAMNTGVMTRVQEMDMKKLLSDSKEQFYVDIKRQVVEYVTSFKPGAPSRRDLFYTTLYTALVLTAQTEDALLRKKMLIRTYSWLLTNKSKAHLSTSTDQRSPPKPIHTVKSPISHLQCSIPYSEKLFLHKNRENNVKITTSLTKKLEEFRNLQMKSLQDVTEAKHALRSWGRAKSRAEERNLYRNGVKTAAKSSFSGTNPRPRPPTVINCTRRSNSTQILTNIRPKSKLERVKMRAERLFQFEEVMRMKEIEDLGEMAILQGENLRADVDVLKYRLSQSSTLISYKTLARGLLPPRPLHSTPLPQGGELLTSNPFQRFTVEKTRKIQANTTEEEL